MEIILLGTGAIFTSYLSACAIIDSKIMLDCGNGSVKAMRRLNVDPRSIDICLITHFHADHFFDLPFLLLEQGLLQVRHKDFYIVGPSGVGKRIEELFSFAYPNDWEKVKEQSKLNIVEINEDKEEFILEGYDIKCFQVKHSDNLAYGYTLKHNGVSVGFTGDAEKCPGVIDIVNESDWICIDMSFETPYKGHMSLNDIEELYLIYGNEKKIIPTHMSDEARRAFSVKYFTAPIDGERFCIPEKKKKES